MYLYIFIRQNYIYRGIVCIDIIARLVLEVIYESNGNISLFALFERETHASVSKWCEFNCNTIR